jgi:hypothetical protein
MVDFWLARKPQFAMAHYNKSGQLFMTDLNIVAA